MQPDEKKRRPGRPKQSEQPQTMELIMRTAAVLFMDQGFNKVSLESVAAACNITKASVYYYFKNKAMLFTRCVTFILSIAYKQTEIILLGEGSLRERMLRVAKGHMRNAHIEFETMMREAEMGLSQEQVEEIRASEQAIHHLLSHHLAIAMEKKQIRACDPMLLAHLFTATLTIRNRTEILHSYNDSIEAVAEEIVEVLFAGLELKA